MIYNNSACDMTTMTTPFSTSGAGQQAPAFPLGHQAESQHQNQTEYMGKLLPSSNKRFALSGMNNNSTEVQPGTAGSRSNHYQNLRVYYQLAF